MKAFTINFIIGSLVIYILCTVLVMATLASGYYGSELLISLGLDKEFSQFLMGVVGCFSLLMSFGLARDI